MTENNNDDYIDREVPRDEWEAGSDEAEGLHDGEVWPESNAGKSPARFHGRNPFQLWLISYADFMTILTIFFLAMYGYTYLDAASLLMPKQNISYSAFTDLVKKLQTQSGDQISVQDKVDKVEIELGEKILFASGSAKLALGAEETLGQLANSLTLVDGDIIVQGHTDNIPFVGKRYRSNWELSAARAFSVIEMLTVKGVPAKRLAAWGFGENRPEVLNDTPEHRAQNRRIEIVVLKAKQKVS